jgi:hypothetical protein
MFAFFLWKKTHRRNGCLFDNDQDRINRRIDKRNKYDDVAAIYSVKASENTDDYSRSNAQDRKLNVLKKSTSSIIDPRNDLNLVGRPTSPVGKTTETYLETYPYEA